MNPALSEVWTHMRDLGLGASEIPSFCYVNQIRRQSWRDRTSGILKVGRIAHLN